MHVHADGALLEVSSFGTHADRARIPPDAATFLPRSKALARKVRQAAMRMGLVQAAQHHTTYTSRLCVVMHMRAVGRHPHLQTCTGNQRGQIQTKRVCMPPGRR